MLDKINQRVIMAYMFIQSALGRIREDESGMEVMQIVLLLGAGIAVILILVGFGGQITEAVGQQVQKVLQAIGAG